jgi:1-deoxy-D-xylulose-5-phosphate reductoisomerase
MQNITILGATGSIGVSTLDVIARHPDRYRVYALTAHSRIAELAALCLRFRPEVAVTGSAEGASELAALLARDGVATEVLWGEAALCRVASAGACDAVMAAIVGAAGLAPSLAAAQAGKKVLLANKEALVMSGQLFMTAVADSGATLLPIDSEHNAIFQCLPHDFNRATGAGGHGIARILLTASGGPFLGRAADTLGSVTPEEAVAHPNWVMGRKISVDSATMMNKGLEVIEAAWLFGASAAQIEVLIHPQSVIHSMVQYRDTSVVAQLGTPDMRVPIAYGLAWPERVSSGAQALDFGALADMSFESLDTRGHRERFPGLQLAWDSLAAAPGTPAVLNAANEVAVAAFLDRRIRFDQIHSVNLATLESVAPSKPATLQDLLDLDARARRGADEAIRRLSS